VQDSAAWSIVGRFNQAPYRRCELKNKLSNQVVSKQSPLLLLSRSLSFIFLLLILGLVLWAQKEKDQPPAKPPEFKIPPEAAAKVNPVRPTAESLAKGKRMYSIDCAMCHGKDGDGKGDMGADFKSIPDFTNPEALKNRTDGELFYVTRNGKGDMPAEDNRAKDDDIWNMVNYMRAFAKK
jgi:mono/diheme cytochrome c family protein